MTHAPYATTDQNSRGRQYSIPDATDRNAFARDYTRVLHSQALRRLQHKTQVFSSNEGDLFRTRLTHSMEVEQVARSVSKQLGLNEDLCAVLALAHDLGHAPFGHMGQDILNELLKDHGGFEHNHQALRIVDELESPYPEHIGLNLMFETREGLLKHCTQERARGLGDIGRRHLDNRPPTLEAQVVDISDAIAYVHADLEDAFLMGLLSAEEMEQAPGYKEAMTRLSKRGFVAPKPEEFEDQDPSVRRGARARVQSVVREMMRHSIDDMTSTSKLRIQQANPQTPDEARSNPPLVGFSPEQRKLHAALRKFSHKNIYEHEQVVRVRGREREVLEQLFIAYEANPEQMDGYPLGKGEDLYRRLSDHLSGMTDLRAHAEYRRLFTEKLAPAPRRASLR
jgi:dGTPase